MYRKLKFISLIFISVLLFNCCKKDPQVNPPILIAKPVTTAPVKVTDSVYPNPSNGTFTIGTNSTTNQTATMFDVMGRIKFNLVISGTTAIIADSLASGIYFLKITNNIDTVIKKLVIQH